MSNPVLDEDKEHNIRAGKEDNHPDFENKYIQELAKSLKRILKEIYPDLRS
jgi:hypothetical protein